MTPVRSDSGGSGNALNQRNLSLAASFRSLRHRNRGHTAWLAPPARQDSPRPRDTSITTYRAKRDFTVTAEPAPGKTAASKDAPIFVVQKHQAHRAGLHYDFRLEHNGVLWSWAVRKGPSLDPSIKHIAAHVEDHPIDYADFQGTIPDGQYGAGTVETWDRGTWEPVNDPEPGMQKGELTFVLHGKRLNGRFHLVRLKPKPGSPQQGRQLAVVQRPRRLRTRRRRSRRDRASHARAQAGARPTPPNWPNTAK